MPIADIIANSDIARRPDCMGQHNGCNGFDPKPPSNDNCNCNCNEHNGCMPYPPFAYLVPPPPPAGYPCPPVEENPSIRQNATEKSICKLSKKAAALRSLIENISVKNKPVIIKSAAVSYNLGSFKTKDPDDEGLELLIEDENIDTIINILKAKLEEVKEQIKELSDELVED